MSQEVRRELYFLIAKYLKEQFPELGQEFIKECEAKHLFPSRVFIKNPSFETLDEKILTGIPNDQLMRLILLACPKSQFPSLFFNEAQKIPELTKADLITYNIDQPIQDFPTFAPHKRIAAHFEACYCLAVDNTSQIIITGADDYVIKIWKIPELILIHSITRMHDKEITEIAIHPQNHIFASSSYDGKICIFSLHKGEFIREIQFDVPIHALRFSPCGRYLAAAAGGGLIKVFTIDGDEINLLFEFSLEKDCAWLSFSPCGNFLAVSADEGILVVANIEEQQIVKLDGHKKTPDFVFFSKTSPNSIISIATKERGLKKWVVDDSLWGRCFNFSTKCITNIKNRLVACCWNADDSRICAISQNYIFAWDSLTRKNVSICTHPTFTDHCSSIAANPVFPSVVFVGTQSGMASIWDIEKGELINGFAVENGKINDAVWSKDGRSVYSVDQCGGITAYQCGTTGRLTTTQMFFPREIEDPIEGSENNTIVDSQGHPLDVQPKRYTLDDLNLNVKDIKFPESLLNQEEKIIEKWHAVQNKKTSNNNQRRRRRRDGRQEEEDEEEDEEDENVEREVLNIHENGQMSKRSTAEQSMHEIEESENTESESSEANIAEENEQDDDTDSDAFYSDEGMSTRTRNATRFLEDTSRLRERTRTSSQFSPPPRRSRRRNDTTNGSRTSPRRSLPPPPPPSSASSEQRQRTRRRLHASRLSPPRERRHVTLDFSSSDSDTPRNRSRRSFNDDDAPPTIGIMSRASARREHEMFIRESNRAQTRTRSGRTYASDNSDDSFNLRRSSRRRRRISSSSSEDYDEADKIIVKKPIRKPKKTQDDDEIERMLIEQEKALQREEEENIQKAIAESLKSERVRRPVRHFSSDDEEKTTLKRRKRASALSPPPQRKSNRTHIETESSTSSDEEDETDSDTDSDTSSYTTSTTSETTSDSSSESDSPKPKSENKVQSTKNTKQQDQKPEIKPTTAPTKERKHQFVSDWHVVCDPDDPIYVPQLNERIVYIARAYSIWKQQHKMSQYQAPHTSNKGLNPVGIGVIKALSHKDDGLLLDLQFDGDDTIYQVFFIPNSTPCYLVSYTRYTDSLIEFTVGQNYTFMHKGEQITTTLESQSSTNDPFEKLKFKVRTRNAFKSPWDILDIKTTLTEEQELFMNTLADQIKQLFNRNKTSRTLADCLHHKNIISTNYPMSLKLIYDRCKNGWYKTTFQIFQDVQRIAEIAEILKLPSDAVHTIINLICQKIISTFEGFPLPDDLSIFVNE